MKFLMVLTLCFSFSAFADHHEKMEDMSFEDAKKMKLEKLDMKAKMIEEQRACLNAATDKDGLRKCWEDMKAKSEAMMKDKKKDMKKKGKKK